MKDPAFGRPAYLARWQAIFPHAQVETLDDASHYLQEDRPDRISEAIRKVLGRK
jgi:haloalkane dehalogenase